LEALDEVFLDLAGKCRSKIFIDSQRGTDTHALFGIGEQKHAGARIDELRCIFHDEIQYPVEIQRCGDSAIDFG
jgi:hypothetical protein